MACGTAGICVKTSYPIPDPRGVCLLVAPPGLGIIGDPPTHGSRHGLGFCRRSAARFVAPPGPGVSGPTPRCGLNPASNPSAESPHPGSNRRAVPWAGSRAAGLRSIPSPTPIPNPGPNPESPRPGGAPEPLPTARAVGSTGAKAFMSPGGAVRTPSPSILLIPTTGGAGVLVAPPGLGIIGDPPTHGSRHALGFCRRSAARFVAPPGPGVSGPTPRCGLNPASNPSAESPHPGSNRRAVPWAGSRAAGLRSIPSPTPIPNPGPNPESPRPGGAANQAPEGRQNRCPRREPWDRLARKHS